MIKFVIPSENYRNAFAKSTVTTSEIALIITYSGLSLNPYDSSEKNLIKPALDAGICAPLSFFFFLLTEISKDGISFQVKNVS